MNRYHSCKCVGQVHPSKMDKPTCCIRYSPINEVNLAGLLFQDDSSFFFCQAEKDFCYSLKTDCSHHQEDFTLYSTTRDSPFRSVSASPAGLKILI